MFSHPEQYQLLLYLAAQAHPCYAIYGAGKFAKDMLAFIQERRLPLPIFVLDDKPGAEPLGSVPILTPQKTMLREIDGVILGTDTWQSAMRTTLRALRPSLHVVDLCPPAGPASPTVIGAAPDSIEAYLAGGRIPWSPGYLKYEQQEVSKAITSERILNAFRNRRLPAGFGYRLSDRIVEYPWLFSHLNMAHTQLLDAGSVLNFEYLVDHPALRARKMTILTLAPEGNCFFQRAINYLYEDLRHIPLRSSAFDEIVCLSTLEHIDMDNTLYGAADPEKRPPAKSAAKGYKRALSELVRVLRPGGDLYVTVPYGRYEHHGFFQQFDRSMISDVRTLLAKAGSVTMDFFRYRPNGWHCASQKECDTLESFDPHTGRGQKDDGAAHSRGICALHFRKKR